MNHSLKYYLFLFAFGVCSLNAAAKKGRTDASGEPLFRNAVSINFLEPVLKVLSKNQVSDSGFNLKAPMIYIGKQTPKMFYRIGARVTMRNKSHESDLFSDKKDVRYNKYELALSALRMKEVSSKIKVGYGPTVSSFVLFDKQIFDSGFDKVTFDNTSWSAAAGANVLLQYAVSKRLSIFTEYLFAYQFVKTYSGKKFSAFPEENYANEKSTHHNFQFDYPISIYITYHF